GNSRGRPGATLLTLFEKWPRRCRHRPRFMVVRRPLLKSEKWRTRRKKYCFTYRHVLTLRAGIRNERGSDFLERKTGLDSGCYPIWPWFLTLFHPPARPLS